MITMQQKRNGMKHAILSACWGALAQILVKESSVIILFAMLIGAGDMLSIFTTSILDVILCLTMVPFAYLAGKVGNKKAAIVAVCIGNVSLLLCSAAPWFGPAARYILIFTLTIYALSISAFNATWFPVLDGIVPENERGRFFGRLRMSWQTTSGIFLLLSGFFVGQTASIGKLQLIIAVAALATIGRAWHVSRITIEEDLRATPLLKPMLLDVLGNRPLMAFGIYLCLLYSAASATLPVAFMMAKKNLTLPDNLVVMLSAIVFIGTIAGYFAGGRSVDKFGVKPVFLIAHFGFAVVNFAMLFIRNSSPSAVIFLAILLMLQGLLFASASIAVSTEIMALSPLNNKAISIAVCFSFYSAGIGFSRMLSSFVLGSGMLADKWLFFGINMNNYHTMFLCYGVAVLLTCSALVLVPALTKGVKRLPSI